MGMPLGMPLVVGPRAAKSCLCMPRVVVLFSSFPMNRYLWGKTALLRILFLKKHMNKHGGKNGRASSRGPTSEDTKDGECIKMRETGRRWKCGKSRAAKSFKAVELEIRLSIISQQLQKVQVASDFLRYRFDQ